MRAVAWLCAAAWVCVLVGSAATLLQLAVVFDSFPLVAVFGGGAIVVATYALKSAMRLVGEALMSLGGWLGKRATYKSTEESEK